MLSMDDIKYIKRLYKAPRKQRHTAKRVYERLLEEFPQKLEVKQRTVQAYVAE